MTAEMLTIEGRHGPIDVSVPVPGSKSVANRLLVCAMLAEGESYITGLPDGDDVAALVAALERVGRCTRVDDSLVVRGGLSSGPLLDDSVHCALAGTTSRFLTAVAALDEGETLVDGHERLRERPMVDLHAALRELGATVIDAGAFGHLPVRVARGDMKGGRIRVRGDSSSQFLSALMMIGPLLDGGLVVDIEGSLVSRPYVEMTAHVMERFGVKVEVGESTVIVPRSDYQPCHAVVEPDHSSAAFVIAAALIAGGRARVPGLGRAALQGDEEMLRIAQAMGATVHVDGDVAVEVPVGPDNDPVLHPIDIDMSECSDLVPAVAVACLFAQGVSNLRGVGFIRHKESDRLGDLARELTKTGATVREHPDGLEIVGGAALQTARFATHDDHRLAMALSLVALAGVSVVIEDPDVVTKSWPNFFSDMSEALGTRGSDN